jgi:hypothetical protein
LELHNRILFSVPCVGSTSERRENHNNHGELTKTISVAA